MKEKRGYPSFNNSTVLRQNDNGLGPSPIAHLPCNQEADHGRVATK